MGVARGPRKRGWLSTLPGRRWAPPACGLGRGGPRDTPQTRAGPPVPWCPTSPFGRRSGQVRCMLFATTQTVCPWAARSPARLLLRPVWCPHVRSRSCKTSQRNTCRGVRDAPRAFLERLRNCLHFFTNSLNIMVAWTSGEESSQFRMFFVIWQVFP